MQLIAADIGNSSIKLAIGRSFDDDAATNPIVISDSDPIELVLDKEQAFWTICSVSQSGLKKLYDWVAVHRPADRLHIIHDRDVALPTAVVSREELGKDRLVAAWMAFRLADRNGPIVVVDSGTAVTIDLIDAQGVFRGGVIFPGFSASLRSLAAATDALPDLSRGTELTSRQYPPQELIGRDTSCAIASGVFYSQLAAVLTIVEKMQQLCDDASSTTKIGTCPVYATGGGLAAIQKSLPEDWRFVPELVLCGTREIGRQILGLSPRADNDP
jgi:type III pantothenate kinase